MKITIDTKEESHEDIRKLIGMLQNIVDSGSSYSSIGSTSSEDKDNQDTPSGMFNLFGNNSSEEESIEEHKEEPIGESKETMEDSGPEITLY